MLDRRPHLPTWLPGRSDAGSAPMFRFNQEREGIVEETTTRAVEILRPRAEALLLEAAYLETKRLEAASHSDEARRELPRWRELAKQVTRLGASECERLLEERVRHYAWDIAGNFDPRVFRFASKVVPVLLTGAVSPSSLPSRLLGGDPLADRIKVEGDSLDTLRALSKRATLVVTPTHVSNLDSIVLGYVLDRVGLPPMTYGAGKNLFSNPLISFFMHNLGAYRVDRRLKHDLYKNVLKAYSTVILERGYHSIFFPGGTRSRSGAVESKLKLGLLGTGIEAFTRSSRTGRDKPLVVYVPTSINFLLTLEAESLVEDYLQDAGKARYIIEDDEFSRAERWMAFLAGIMRLKGAVIFRFGPPLDPFGNLVGPDGVSYDSRGRAIDPIGYVLRDGVPVVDPARDAEYTRELGQSLVRYYASETVLVSTQVLARVLFDEMGEMLPGVDLFARLRLGEHLEVDRERVLDRIGALQDRLLRLEARGLLHLSRAVAQSRATEIVERALIAWRDYHGARAPAAWRNGKLVLGDLKLLFYYQNRLSVYSEALADA